MDEKLKELQAKLVALEARIVRLETVLADALKPHHPGVVVDSGGGPGSGDTGP